MSWQKVVEMKQSKQYVAVYERDFENDVWLVHAKGINGCQTYGRSLRQAMHRIQEALAVWLDCDPDEIALSSEFPTKLSSAISEVARSRAAAERAETRARDVTAETVRKLTEMGLSRRDAAELVGISHQRVQQLLASGF
jgi:predicted RNase H-like HicB family nuclease